MQTLEEYKVRDSSKQKCLGLVFYKKLFFSLNFSCCSGGHREDTKVFVIATFPTCGNCDTHRHRSSSHQRKPTRNLLLRASWWDLPGCPLPAPSQHPRSAPGGWVEHSAEGRRRGKLGELSIAVLWSDGESQPGSAPALRAMIFISHSPCLFQLEW